MWALILTACGVPDRPAQALTAAAEALEAGDLAAFEAVVDLEATAPVVFETCMRIRLDAHLDDYQFQPPRASQRVGMGLETALTEAIISEKSSAPDQFRKVFPNVNREDCSGLVWGAPTLGKREGEHATLNVPVTIGGSETTWNLALTKGERWKIVGVDPKDAVSEHRTYRLDQARGVARALVATLPGGAPHDDWQAIRNYTHNQPGDTEVADLFEAAMAPLVAAEFPLEVTDVGLFMPRGLLPVRNAGARVRNGSGKALQGYTLQFWFEDVSGGAITAASGDSFLRIRRGPLPVDGEDRIAVKAGSWSWPTAARARASVLEIDWRDGSRWTHPAVQAGAWTVHGAR